MGKVGPVLLIAAILSASPAHAQIGVDLGTGFSVEPPFKISAVLDRTAVLGGQPFRVGVVLEPALGNKIYRSSVAVSLVEPFPQDPEGPSGRGADFRVTAVDVPPGQSAHGEATPTPGDTVFLTRTVVVIHMLAPVGRLGAGGQATLEFTVAYQGCSTTQCFPVQAQPLRVEVPVTDSPGQSLPANTTDFEQEKGPDESLAGPRDRLAELARRTEEARDFSRDVAEKGYLVAFLAAFGSGFLVSLTPCVWPLIPIVLAIVGASAEGAGWRRGLGLSLAYVLGIALTYAVLGALAGAIGRSVHGFTQSPWVVGVVCLAFVALALSMFGLYDIRVPSALAGKLQPKRGTGFPGVFVMGIVSGLVASPCVSAPLLALYTGAAMLKSVWIGALAGFVFALGMGVILVVAGTSSKALAALPRSGEWMVSVKHFFGWVMLGAAVWFSEMLFGDLAYRALMMSLLASAATSLASRRSAPPAGRLHRPVRAVGIITLLLGFLYFVSGFISTAQYRVDGIERERSGQGVGWYASVDEGLARAKGEGKPAIVDVWASWCTYCHEMDREVFATDAVVAESRRFVMVKLDATVQTDAVGETYRRYGIVAPPAFVFVRSDGTHETVNGKIDLETFLKLMRATP